MEEIKVGEYVRDKDGNIGKYLGNVKALNRNCYKVGCMLMKYKLENIVNHSKNKIDLIKAGDYVNGRLVLQVDYKNKNVCLLIPLTDTQANTNIMWYGYEDIKTIVTKEQFASLEYKIKEE